ncbi:MAG: tRNA uridine-5-carboxymethylaminomethyl(34) synthesis GTPase MnmE [Bacteroidetes bacterium]|nr:tRNA uridine-5-carboxymethylaminomethyl(34) synthesis GTPase MnmE [Bacteroidota bacterium]
MSIFTGTDTICALSTPAGMGAIAVIRISGPEAFPLCSRIFTPAEKDLDLASAPSHTIHFGRIGSKNDLLDEVLVSIFRAPRSYTGEDVIEISCHGSTYIQQKVLELILSEGARMAKPGEFTLRAFMNGKFDLSQAEAVADLIISHSRSSHDLALKQMRGGFSEKIRELRQKLVDFTSLIELELDFSEENVEFASRQDLTTLLNQLESEIKQLIDSFTIGNVIKNGIPVAIIGKPNVGKSTLLNAILNEEKAIVSEIAGTTRDAIEDTIVIGGYSFRFIDTAGLRAARDKIESIGIERTWEKINQASIILYVFDSSLSSFDDVMDSASEFRELISNTPKRLILVGNKMDQLVELPHGFKDFVEYETIFVSAKRKENIHLLAESLVNAIKIDGLSDNTIVSNARHLDALKHALEAIEAIHDGLKAHISPDLLTVEIRQALYHLGSITGEITTEEILGNIFGKFCIGK